MDKSAFPFPYILLFQSEAVKGQDEQPQVAALDLAIYGTIGIIVYGQNQYLLFVLTKCVCHIKQNPI